MSSDNHSELKQRLQRFRHEFCRDLCQLMSFLQQAGISHYASGCGIKSVAFELFPASDQVAKFMELLSLDRPYRAASINWLRDYAPAEGYNPAHHFIKHLQRWSGFAGIVMHSEGDSPRGIAAANAKVLLDSLGARLEKSSWPPKAPRPKTLQPLPDFALLMQDIGMALLEASPQAQEPPVKNYDRALAAARRPVDA